MNRLVKFNKYVSSIYQNISSLIEEVKVSQEHPYSIAAWVEKPSDRDKDILLYHVNGTDKYINHFSVSEIYENDDILMGFSKKEIKYISTLAILTKYKMEPKYSVVWRSFRNSLQNAEVHLKDKFSSKVFKVLISDLEREIKLIDGMSSSDAFVLGKEVGIRERLAEERLIKET